MNKWLHTNLRRGGALTAPATAERGRAPSGGRRGAFVALAAAGVLWGLTVPLSKLALDWLDAGWLTVMRFGLAAPLLLLATRRSALRRALTPGVAVAGAIGFGLVIVLQNVGISKTNVSHASLIVGAVPVLVALISVAIGRGTAGPPAWAGNVLAIAGVGLVAGAGGAGSSLDGDAIVLASVVLSAAFIVAQPRLLRGRDPVAVTAVQLAAGALAALPYAVAAEGMPPAPAAETPVLAAIGLAIAGTLLAFSLFAYGQSRVPADVAGAFVNLEPLVGALAATVAFHEPFGPVQLAGAAAILAGLALGSVRLPGDRAAVPEEAARGAVVRERRPPTRCRPLRRPPDARLGRPCRSPPSPDTRRSPARDLAAARLRA